jgi:thiazole/oxazole-forming peptide maturase SagD family component
MRTDGESYRKSGFGAMNGEDDPTVSLTLMPRQATEVGRIAARVDAGQQRFTLNHDCGFGTPALEWLASLGCLRRRTIDGAPLWTSAAEAGAWPGLLRLLGPSIEALVDITPEASPVKLVTAFERNRAKQQRRIFCGRGARAMDALKGCLFEAVETFAALWATIEERAPEAADQAVPKVDWTAQAVEGVSVVTGATLMLPLYSVFLDAPQDLRPPGARCCDSNGLAAGEVYQEASLSALLELIERDAVAVWWRSRYRPRTLRLSTRVGIASLYAIECFLHTRGRRLYLFDLTHDLDVPVVVALSTDPEGCRPLIGAAADFLADDAAYAAAAELLQMEANVSLIRRSVAKEGPDTLPAKTRRLWDWYSTASVDLHPFLRPSDGPPVGRDDRLVALPRCMETLQSAMRAAGVDATLVDLGRERFGFPVARAVSAALMDFNHTNERARSVPGLIAVDPDWDCSRPLNPEPVPL